MRWFLVFALLSAPVAAGATSLKSFWDTRPADAPHFQSTKSSAALEMCLGMELSSYGVPPYVLNGEGEKLITVISSNGFSQTPVAGVRIIDHGTSREIIVGALQTGGWTNRISGAVQRCA